MPAGGGLSAACRHATASSTAANVQHACHPSGEACMPCGFAHIMRRSGVTADFCYIDQAKGAHGHLSSAGGRAALTR